MRRRNLEHFERDGGAQSLYLQSKLVVSFACSGSRLQPKQCDAIITSRHSTELTAKDDSLHSGHHQRAVCAGKIVRNQQTLPIEGKV